MVVASTDSTMEKGRTLRVDVQCDAADTNVPAAAVIADWINLTAKWSGFEAGGEVSVRVVDAGEMRALNRRFRRQDKTTNVLAFPGGELAGLPAEAGRLLGDIVVCAPVVRAEADAQDKPLADHWAHMLVHGMLHLLGHDHVEPRQARNMERLEAEILASRGVRDPYDDR